MEKKFCAYIFIITFITLSSIVYAEEVVARAPSVEPMAEIDIEDTSKEKTSQNTGFDFKNDTKEVHNRVPANITTKTQASSSTSFLGPLIFLLTLPIGLWIIISKKLSKSSAEKPVDYYPKTHQFKPYKTDYQKTAEDEDDDINYPKAS